MANLGTGGPGQADDTTTVARALTATDAAWAALGGVHSGDALMVTDSVGTVLWANAVAADMLGHPPGALVGINMFGLLTPEEQHLALQAIVFVEHLPDLVIPAVYNPLRADGTRVPMDVNATLVPELDETARALLAAAGAPDLDPPLMVVTARLDDHGNLLSDGFERLTRGEPFSLVVADILAELVERWPSYHSGLIMTERGRRVVHGDVPRTLRPAMTAAPFEHDPTAPDPWTLAVESGGTVFRPVGELPPPLARVAADAGMQACLAIALPDSTDLDPVLVLWIGTDAPFVIEAFWTGSPYFTLLSFALQRFYYLSTLETAATTDSLTGLANRATFFDRLESTTSSVVAVLYLDLDNFKPINDRFGHAVGDAVLAEVATRLRNAMRPGDLVARLGGDELAVLCTSIATVKEATSIADRLLGTLVEPVTCADEKVVITASIGIALHRGPALQGDALVECADRALYRAKRAGKGRWILADDDTPDG